MKNKFFVSKSFLLLIFLLVGSTYAKQPDWLIRLKRIETFKSTKTDVEKLFGNPRVVRSENLATKIKNGWGERIEYETKYGHLEVEYSTGNCLESKSRYGYDVNKNVAVGLVFFPNEITYENQIGYNLNKFNRISSPDSDTIYSFESDELGIKIEIRETKIYFVNFYITDKQKEFECKNTPKVTEPNWLVNLRKIEIFKSTRAEVEKLFNNPKILSIYDSAQKENGWGLEIEYETEDGDLEIEYSTGNCSESKSKYGYDINKDVVAELTFRPKKPILYTELDFDLRKFKSEPVTDMSKTYIHSNDNLGIKIFMVDGKVETIEFGLTNEHKKLDCEVILKENFQK